MRKPRKKFNNWKKYWFNHRLIWVWIINRIILILVLIVRVLYSSILIAVAWAEEAPRYILVEVWQIDRIPKHRVISEINLAGLVHQEVIKWDLFHLLHTTSLSNICSTNQINYHQINKWISIQISNNNLKKIKILKKL